MQYIFLYNCIKSAYYRNRGCCCCCTIRVFHNILRFSYALFSIFGFCFYFDLIQAAFFFHQLAIAFGYALGYACFVSFKRILLYLSSFNVQYARLLNLIVLKTDNFFFVWNIKKSHGKTMEMLEQALTMLFHLLNRSCLALFLILLTWVKPFIFL